MCSKRIRVLHQVRVGYAAAGWLLAAAGRCAFILCMQSVIWICC